MDSKTFLENYKKIYAEYIAFIDGGINKNVLKAEEIVSEYLTEVEARNYSLKSYKAKIIRNEQEHLQNDNDIMETSNVTLNNYEELFNYYFKEYLNELSNSKTYVHRDRDLRVVQLDTRKEKQEFLIKRTTQEKDVQNKEKDKENAINEVKSVYNGKIEAIKEKLYNDLADNKDEYMHSYLEDERKLLDVDEKNQILEIKKTINQKIIKGLEKEYEFKISACETLESTEIEFNEKLEETEIDFDKQINDKHILLCSYDYKLDSLDLILSEKEELFDVDYLIKINKKLYDYQIEYSDILINHCEYINNANDNTVENKLMVLDIALMQFYHIILKLIKKNVYDSFILVIDNIINEIKQNKIKFVKYFDDLTKDEGCKKQALESKLNELYDRQGKEPFIQNVITSLGRFYTNLYKQIDLFYMTYAKTLTKLGYLIIDKYDELIEDKLGHIKDDYLFKVVDYKLFDLSYCKFVNDLSEINRYSSIDEYSLVIRNNIKQNNIISKENYDQALAKLNENKQIIINNYDLKKKNLEMNHNLAEKQIKNDLSKKLETIKKDYKNKQLEIKKCTRNRISNAEKLLKESKKHLIV